MRLTHKRHILTWTLETKWELLQNIEAEDVGSDHKQNFKIIVYI